MHQALKHLVVAGNALIYMGKDLKAISLNRYVVERDGNGNVIEIVTKERIKKLIEGMAPKRKPNSVSDESNDDSSDEIDIYTHVKRDNNRFIWKQEVDGKVLPKSLGKAVETNPWLVLRWNVVDGEVW